LLATAPARPALGGVAARWGAGLLIGALFGWLAMRAWPMEALLGGRWSVEGGAWPRLVQRQAGGPEVWALSLWHVAGYVGLLGIIHAWRVLRWLPLVRAFAPVRLRSLNRIGAVGFMAVFLLPLRLGELVRPALLRQDDGVPFGVGLSMIVVERVSDGLMVSLMLFLFLLAVPASALERSPEVMVGAWAALAVFGGAMLALAATALARGPTTRLLEATVGRVSGRLAARLLGLLTAFLDGLRVLGSPAAVASFLLLTAGYWLTNGLGIWLVARGVGLDLPLSAGYVMMCCVVVGMMIPNSPGNVGSFWYFLLLPIGLWGVDAASPRAVAFALLVWLVQLLQVSAFGAWGAAARARLVRRRRRAAPLG
jgi:uncharacterized protein (TIRG00374 family)